MNQQELFRMFTKGLTFKKEKINSHHKNQDISELSEKRTINDIESCEINDEPVIKKRKKELTQELVLQLKQEEINRTRNRHKIHIWGSDVPAPFVSFDKLRDQLSNCKQLVDNLLNEGYESPTPIQMQAWPLLLQKRNVLASAPTGSGKTAGFLVPIIEQLKCPLKKNFRAVIVSPTTELAKQIYRECIRLCEGIGLKTFMINKNNKMKDLLTNEQATKYDILVTTPNRLVYLLQQTEGKEPLNLKNVEWLVIDESDRLFEDGDKGFRDQMAAIYQACTNPELKRAFFSATFAHDLEKWCKLNIDNIAMISIGARNAACADVHQELLFCGMEDGKFIGLKDLIEKGFQPPMLIFVQSKERAKELHFKIQWNTKVSLVDYISADKTKEERDKSVLALRERKIWILICTELMARGIDFKGINLVVNYDFPPTTISYIHRVGRTGRANQKGRAVTFWTEEDREHLRSVAVIMRESGNEVPDWMVQGKKKKKDRKKKPKQPDRASIAPEMKHFEFLKRKHKSEKKRLKQMKSSTKVKDNNKSKIKIHN